MLLAGKLGRHPKLAREFSGVFSQEIVLTIVKEKKYAFTEIDGYHRSARRI